MLPSMSDALADHILALVRGMGYRVNATTLERPTIGLIWHLEAQSGTGESWIAEDADYYRAAVLPKGVKRVAVEAGVTDYWRKYVGLEGAVIGIDTFGESAPAGVLYKHFGITVEKVVAAAKA